MKIKVIKKRDDDDSSKKIEKQKLLYIYRDGCSYICSECYFYKEKKCALFGQSIEIKPYGGCNLWVKANGTESNWINGITKTEAGYMENKVGFTCGRCEYFIANNNDCQKVNKNSSGDTPNQILSGGCCNGWEKDDEDE